MRGTVNKLLKNPVFHALSDLRLSAILMLLFAIAAAVGTWIESHYANLGSIETGIAAVFELVYDAPWFNALLILFFLNLLLNLVRQILRRRLSLQFLMVHAGMLLILAGAGLTRWWGFEGEIRIREGQAQGRVASSDDYAVVALGNEEAALPVRLYRPGAQSHGASVTLGGKAYTLGVAEFWPRFEARPVPGEGGVARLRLAVAEAGSSVRQDLFEGEDLWIGGIYLRFHKESPADSGRASEELIEGYGTRIDLARQGDRVILRAGFPLDISSAGSDEAVSHLPVGESRLLLEGDLIQGSQGFQVLVERIDPSLVPGGVASENPNAGAAARITLEGEDGRAEAICVLGDEPSPVRLGEQSFELRYGPVYSDLPYELLLQDFVLNTYPGSDNPASYESHLLLNDPEQGIEGRPVRIWMNHPLDHRGIRHFQSSYDPDRLGTVLALNRDPGKGLTYVGYTVISLGFLWVLLRILVRRWQSLRQAAGGGLLLALLCAGLAGECRAEDGPAVPPALELSRANLEAVSRLVVQDFRGRMKPFDTLARETAMKITKRTRFEGREPAELFLGLALHPEAWFDYPAIHVKNPGVQQLLGVADTVHHVALASVMHPEGYTLAEVVDAAHRTPSNRRDKTQQKLIPFDERVHLFFGALQGNALRLFPLPDDPGNSWLTIEKVLQAIPAEDSRRIEFQRAGGVLFEGLLEGNDARTAEGLALVAGLQQRYGAAVIPSALRIKAELGLNGSRPFARSLLPYLLGFTLLITAFFVGLLRRGGARWRFRDPLYLLGMLSFGGAFALHGWGFALRWIASGRAPLSNSHESLLWVALAVALAGLLFELLSRTAAAGALSSLLTAVVLGVSMLSTFDPSIGPLMPVLASYWLTIHVTVITASYGFLGLSCLIGLLTLVLFVIHRRRCTPAALRAVTQLDQLNVDVMIAGIGLLSVGTLLGGVWANESWGRYWGWDPKETWALVSILLYAMLLHFRWIPRLANAFVQAAGSFLLVWSIVMTYFGVNYLLMGLHSYAAGDKVAIPLWVKLACLFSLLFCLVAWRAWSSSRAMWEARAN